METKNPVEGGVRRRRGGFLSRQGAGQRLGEVAQGCHPGRFIVFTLVAFQMDDRAMETQGLQERAGKD